MHMDDEHADQKQRDCSTVYSTSTTHQYYIDHLLITHYQHSTNDAPVDTFVLSAAVNLMAQRAVRKYMTFAHKGLMSHLMLGIICFSGEVVRSVQCVGVCCGLGYV
jgi:hypothetical protein